MTNDIKELKEKLKGFENGQVVWQGDMDRTIQQNLELKKQNELQKKLIHELFLTDEGCNTCERLGCIDGCDADEPAKCIERMLNFLQRRA